MKVKQLIEELETFDPEGEVYFTYNYGDYWQTCVAKSPDYLEDGQVEWSEYHRMFNVVEDEQDYEPGHPDADLVKPAVLIFS